MLRLPLILTALAGAVAALPAASPLDYAPRHEVKRSIESEWNLSDVKLAVVRAHPVNWPMPMINKTWTGVKLDINATVDLGVSIIEQAAANDTRLVAFPEVWFPGYPKGIIGQDDWFALHVKDYIENSITLGDANWLKLVAAAKANKIYVGLSFSERNGNYIYMAQALIDPTGEVLIHRHKLRPSAQERDLWSDGYTEQIYAVDTPIGRIGMLSCGEHTAPEATWIMQMQNENIHIGSWPLVPALDDPALTTANVSAGFGTFAGYESGQVINALGRVYAILSNAVVMQAAIGTATIFPAGSSAFDSQIQADDVLNDVPLVYSSVNTTAFNRADYDSNGEVSWGSLQAINAVVPKTLSYIPQVRLDYSHSEPSRFHTATLDTTQEVDIKDLNVSIGERDLIVGAHLRLKEGVRNGTGKSTLLKAISDKLIPGLGNSIRILLLSQIEDATRAATEEGGSVLDHVVRGDKERLKAVEELSSLTKAVESTSLAETQAIIDELLLSKAEDELVEAKKIAARRSGARGKEAREAEVKAEEKVKLALEKLENGVVEDDVATKAMEMMQDVQLALDLLETDTTDARAATILAGLGFSQEMMQKPYASLSGGWRSRCSLATSLLVRTDILLLDEPSNFLDLEAIVWLEQYLLSYPSTLLLISHDQEFLNNVVEETIILRHQKLKYFEGNPRAWEVNERKERRRLTGQKEAMDKKKEHIEKSIQQGMASAKKTGDENRQRMVKSRQKKLDDRWGIETSAKGGRFKLNRDLEGYHLTGRAALEIEAEEAKIKIIIPSPEKLRTVGDLIHFDKVEYRFSKDRSRAPLLEDVTFTVGQGARVAFIGANGQGKSTIAKLILGQLLPSSGKITRHPLLKIGYFAQHSVEELTLASPVTSLWLDATRSRPTTALSYFLKHFEDKGENVVEQDARACLGSFGLQGKVASDTPLGLLSGGQKVRLAIALLVFHPPLLDEVTTHVDAPTIAALAVALKNFSGAIVLYHSRPVWFSRIVVEGESPRSILAEEADDSDVGSSSDEDDEEGSKAVGKTWRVGGGKIKLMEKGMKQYVGLVERKLEKRRKAGEAAVRSAS
ncbi:Iron complex transport system ATP-binding protein [Pseudohyphozyma bogoriensis]|nr:Iron complex transport system ATP-binding protein [Pseudohyphozyma bogoriensis]